MKSYPKQQSFVTRAAAWYLRDFPLQRGRGLANRVFGKFLQMRVLDGIKLRLINPLEYHQRMLLFENEAFEPEVTGLLSLALQPGMVFFDVGANLGYYTLLASAKVGRAGYVHAFEPVPAQFRHMELNIRINQATNVIPNNCALAESCGERELFLSESWNQGIHSLGRTLNQSSSCRVQCLSIDEYVDRMGIISIDVLKVDVEGAELLVFQGAKQTLATAPPRLIVFEACENHAQALGHSTCDVKRFLEKYQYTIFQLKPFSPLIRVSASTTESYSNLMAIHSSAEDWFHKATKLPELSALMRQPDGQSSS